MVRVRLRARARECTSSTLSSSGLISVVNTFVFVGSVVSVSKEYMYATDHLWLHVTWLATSILGSSSLRGGWNVSDCHMTATRLNSFSFIPRPNFSQFGQSDPRKIWSGNETRNVSVRSL